MEVRETATISEKAASAAKSTGKMLVQFISPGWGSSGYYSPEVLQEAAAERVIPAGTHMYADHPTEDDRKKRPERSIRDLMAVTTSDAQLSANGALVGEVRVMAPYQELITDLKDFIGVSVLGDAKDIFEGEAEGRSGNIIAGIGHISSVDFVTRAGRGGQVLQLLESAQTGTLSESLVEVLPDAWLLDGIHVELAEALEEIATSGAGVKGTAELHAYWRHGEGAAKIRWGVGGDFDRCVSHLRKYVADPEGYCAKMHKDVTGARPGHAAGESDSSERVITILESGLGLDEEGHTYRYKHGWIPLTHTANDLQVAKLPETKRRQYAAARSKGKSHEDAMKDATGSDAELPDGVKRSGDRFKATNPKGFSSFFSDPDEAAKYAQGKQAKHDPPTMTHDPSGATRGKGAAAPNLAPNQGGSHSPGSITTPRGAEHPALNNPGAKKSVTRPGDHADFSKMSDSDLSAAISRAEKSDSPAVKKLLPGLRSEQAKRGGSNKSSASRAKNAIPGNRHTEFPKIYDDTTVRALEDHLKKIKDAQQANMRGNPRYRREVQRLEKQIAARKSQK